MVLTPRTESITGADLSGANATKNRTYTLTYSNPQAARMEVIVANAALQVGVDFTFSGTTVTFLNKVWNDQNITIHYNTASTASGSSYCDTLKVARVSGIARDIVNENVGTGTGILANFDLDNGNVIAGSYTLKYSSSTTDNDFTDLTETTHYTIDKDGGTILLTTAGKTALSTNILWADYTHSPKVSDTVLETYLNPAAAEVDKITGNYWGTPISRTEILDGRENNFYPQTDQPYVTNYDDDDFIQLKYMGVQSITSIKWISGASTKTTVDSDNYRWDEFGFVTFLSDRLPVGKLNIEVIYTHGYDTTPDLVCELCALYASLRAYVAISGGSYDDATSFTLGRKAVTIGEAYVNIREVINQARNRIRDILNQLGPKMDVV